MNRRTLLLASGVTVSSALAGCTGGSGDGDDEADGGGDGNGDETDSEPAESSDADSPQPDDETSGAETEDDDATRPTPQTLSGTGDASEPIGIEGGLTVVESNHEGAESFRVEVAADDGARAIFADNTGPYEGAKAGLLEAGNYTVDVSADGAWHLTVRQPRATAEAADGLPQTLSGTDPVVAGPIAFDGGHTAHATHDGDGVFQVRVFPETGTRPELVVLEQDEYDDSVSFEFDGLGWIDVQADADWTLEIE